MTAGARPSPAFRGGLFFALAACFLVRLVHSYFLGWDEIPFGSDGGSYHGYALAILNRPDWLTNPDFLGSYRPPVYPLFLALVYAIFGEGNLQAVFAAQALIGTATVYYMFRMSVSMFGVRRSYLVLFWGGLYYFYLWYAGTVLRETLIYFLMVAFFYHLWTFLHRSRKSGILLSAHLWAFLLFFVLLVHTDARYLFFVPCFAVLFWIYLGLGAAVRQYALCLVLLGVLMAPWLARNYLAYDGVVLVNTRTLDLRGSDANIRLKLLDTSRITEVEVNPHWQANENYPSPEERAAIKRGENPGDRPAYEVDMILDDVYPATTFLGRKLFYAWGMWSPVNLTYRYSPFPQAAVTTPWSTRHNVASILFYGSLLPFFVAGVFRLLQRRHRAVWFLLFPIVVQAALHFVSFGLERYRTHIDAFIIILGCYGLVEIGSRFASAKTRLS